MIRYQADGELDDSFGNGGGVALFDFGLPVEAPFERPAVFAVEGGIDSEGRVMLIAAQTVQFGFGGRASRITAVKLVARLTPAGNLDPSFGGGDGLFSLDGIAGVESMTIGKRGEVTLALPAARTAGPHLSRATLFRLTSEGTPDETFGENGFRAYSGKIQMNQIASDPKNRVVALGPTEDRTGTSSTRVTRIKGNGVIDRSFGHRGIATVKLPGLSYLQGMTPDRRFGQGGRVLTRFGHHLDAGASEAALDYRGHLVVAGFARSPKVGAASVQVLARYDLTD